MTGSRRARETGAAGLSRLRAFLEGELGTGRVRVEAEGPEGEIAVLRVPGDLLAAVLEPRRRARVVERARREGFRYAALDAEPEPPGAPPPGAEGREGREGAEGERDRTLGAGEARRGGGGCASSSP